MARTQASGRARPAAGNMTPEPAFVNPVLLAHCIVLWYHVVANRARTLCDRVEMAVRQAGRSMRGSSRRSSRAFWIALAILGIIFIIDCTALVILIQSRGAALDSARGSSPVTAYTPPPSDIPGWQTHTHPSATFSLHYPAHRFELASEDATSVSFSNGVEDLGAGVYDNVCQMGMVAPAEVLNCLARNATTLAGFDTPGSTLVHNRLWRGESLNGYEVEYLVTREEADLRVTALYRRWDADTMIGVHLARPNARSSEVTRSEERRLLESFISSIHIYGP